jgi:sterol 24-C-methyltransferase
MKRHEHYLAHRIGLREGMKVLDVGCGVGAPAREIIKFTGVDVIGLNNNDYQIERATHYAMKEGLSNKLSFVKGDFMVCSRSALYTRKIVTCHSLLANAIPT